MMPAVGKSGPGTCCMSSASVTSGVVEHRQAGVDDLGEVVRRDVGGHAHGDAGGAVDQQIRKPRRHDRRLGFGPVVVGHEIDGFFLDVGEQLAGDARHAHFGVTHGGRGVAVHGAEVALTIHQQVAQRKILRHADQRVVHGVVAVRVVFTDDVTDHTGGLLVCLVPVVAQLTHGMQDAAMNGLEAVTNVGQRAAHDDAHGVVEIRLAHLVFEIHGKDFARDFVHGRARKRWRILACGTRGKPCFDAPLSAILWHSPSIIPRTS